VENKEDCYFAFRFYKGTIVLSGKAQLRYTDDKLTWSCLSSPPTEPKNITVSSVEEVKSFLKKDCLGDLIIKGFVED